MFVDYKAAFDIPIWRRFNEALSELRIFAKLIGLCRMAVTATKS